MIDPLKDDVTARMMAVSLGIDPSRARWKEEVLDRLGEEFAKHENPLVPWEAISFARNHQLVVPEWVLDYFSAAAGQFRKALKGVGKNLSEAEAIGRSLGFGAEGHQSSGSGIGRATANSVRDTTLAIAVEAEKSERERQLGRSVGVDKVAECIASELGTSKSTVKRAHSRRKEIAETFIKPESS